jgi:hypothetical protein
MYYTLSVETLAEAADLARTLATPLPARSDGCC